MIRERVGLWAPPGLSTSSTLCGKQPIQRRSSLIWDLFSQGGRSEGPLVLNPAAALWLSVVGVGTDGVPNLGAGVFFPFIPISSPGQQAFVS